MTRRSRVLLAVFALGALAVLTAGCGTEQRPAAFLVNTESEQASNTPSVAAPSSANTDAAQWLENAIAATQAAGSFTFLSQTSNSPIENGTALTQCTKRQIDYNAGVYQDILADLDGAQLHATDSSCQPDSDVPSQAVIGDRYYPFLDIPQDAQYADASFSGPQVVQAPADVQRAYWDEYLLPWKCYRTAVSSAVTAIPGTTSLVVTTAPGDLTDDCHRQYYVNVTPKEGITWTFTLDNAGRLQRVEMEAPDDAISAADPWDGMAHQRDLFVTYGQTQPFKPGLNGLSEAELAKLPVWGTATSTNEILNMVTG